MSSLSPTRSGLRSARLMGVFALLLALVFERARAGQIQSKEITINYNYDGYPKQYVLYFALECGLGPLEYFHVRWPYDLGPIPTITASLEEYESGLQLGTLATASQQSTSLDYKFSFGAALQPNVWYAMTLSTQPQNVPTGLTPVPVELLTISSADAGGHLIYDYSTVFAQLAIAPLPATQPTVPVSAPYNTLNYTRSAQAQYFLYIDIVTSTSQTNGA